MQQEILEYLNSQRICVLAVEMPDGSPHAATVHFAYAVEPLVFYFKTNKNYRKSEALLGGKNSRASLVVGTDEQVMKTFQADGIVNLIQDYEKEHYNTIFLGKFPEKADKPSGPDDVFFKFTPTWWRYTDFKTPQGKLILTSTDS